VAQLFSLGSIERVKKLPYFLLVSVVFVGSLYVFLFLTPQARVRHVEHEYVAAVKHLNQSPAGIARGEEFIREIRAIDVQHAPPEIQQDMRDYADALDQALQTLKQGGDGSAYDHEVAGARDKLVADFKKYNQ
jgi:hypothetical protein